MMVTVSLLDFQHFLKMVSLLLAGNRVVAIMPSLGKHLSFKDLKPEAGTRSYEPRATHGHMMKQESFLTGRGIHLCVTISHHLQVIKG